PRSFADLLHPRWLGKIVKGHPGYSGTILTATFQITREIGWDYLERLAKQRVLQVQSSTDPPKKLVLGERAVMADGNEYNVFQMKESGQPLDVVYATEGTPLITGPSAIFNPHPIPMPLGYSSTIFSRRRLNKQFVIWVGYAPSIRWYRKNPDVGPYVKLD